MQEETYNSDFICIKALENGVNVFGVTRGRDTRLHHTERLDAGEVLIAQFTEITSAIKIRGKAQILTRYGEICSDSRPAIRERVAESSEGTFRVKGEQEA